MVILHIYTLNEIDSSKERAITIIAQFYTFLIVFFYSENSTLFSLKYLA